jgi:hypothetical protein
VSPPPPAEAEEGLPPSPAEPEEGLPPSPAEPEEVPPPPLEEVQPPPPEEVKWLKPPRRKVPPPLRAPIVNFEDACFSVKMLYQAWQSLGKVVVHLGVQRPTDPLQTTVMDYTFKVNVLAGTWREKWSPPSTTMTTTMAASTSPALALTPTVGLLRRRLLLLN